MLKPINDLVLVKIIRQTETRSGIILTVNKKKLTDKGQIIAVGDGIREDGKFIPFSELGVKVGDYIIFNAYNYVVPEEGYDEEDYAVVDYKGIVGIL